MLISVVQYSTANVLYISASVELSYKVVCGLDAPDIWFSERPYVRPNNPERFINRGQKLLCFMRKKENVQLFPVVYYEEGNRTCEK